MSDTEPAIVALIPAYNEERTIGEVVEQAKTVVSTVIVLDDGSDDETATVAKEHGAIVSRSRRNMGLGETMKRGYKLVQEYDPAVVVQFDADGQYDPTEARKLVQPILDDRADMVLGTRFDRLDYDMPRLNYYGNRAFTGLLRLVTGADIKDGQTGFRAIHPEVLNDISLKGDYTYTQEMIIRVAKRGFRIENVPVTFSERSAGESRLISHPLSYAWRGWLIITRTMRDYHPLSVFGIPGLLLILSGVLLGTSLVVKFLRLDYIGQTPSVILTALLVILGVQFIFIGLLADMLKD